jgi:hypothetical protein
MLGVLCFFTTFFLVGIWHGRTSEFVIFGDSIGDGKARPSDRTNNRGISFRRNRPSRSTMLR